VPREGDEDHVFYLSGPCCLHFDGGLDSRAVIGWVDGPPLGVERSEPTCRGLEGLPDVGETVGAQAAAQVIGRKHRAIMLMRDTFNQAGVGVAQQELLEPGTVPARVGQGISVGAGGGEAGVRRGGGAVLQDQVEPLSCRGLRPHEGLNPARPLDLAGVVVIDQDRMVALVGMAGPCPWDKGQAE